MRRSRTRWECGHHSDWNSAGNILAGLVEAVLVQVDPVDDDLVVLEVVGHLDRDVLADDEHALVEVWRGRCSAPRASGFADGVADRQPEPGGRIELRVARERQRPPTRRAGKRKPALVAAPFTDRLPDGRRGSASRDGGYRGLKRNDRGYAE